MRYGPNHQVVSELLDRVAGFPWFSAVDKPLPGDRQAIRFDFYSMVSMNAFSYAAWGNVL
ncbi:MAG: hypothetical protein GY869_21995, partial [Planctomycetes bacterium]|nr:hypothetical protein [Planctomycetota bacterium]